METYYMAICHDKNDEVLVSTTYDTRKSMQTRVNKLFDIIEGTEYIVLYKVNGESEDSAGRGEYLTTVDKFNVIEQ